jgi:hypothetical protein
MAGMMDLVLYGGLAIVGLNIFKPDILPDFLQIPQLQGLIKLPGAGDGTDAGAGGDPSTQDPSAGDGQGGHRKGKRKQAAFARAYAVGYGQNFYG